jgi:hypothetical protein
MTMFKVYVDVVWAYGAGKVLTSHIYSFSQLVQRTLGGPFPRYSQVTHDRSDQRLLILSALSKGAILPIDTIPNASAGPAVASRKRFEALRRCFQSSTYSMGDRDAYLANALNQLDQIPPKYLAAIESSSSYGLDLLSPSMPTDWWDMPFKSSQQNRQTRLFLGMNGEIRLAASCIREDDILCQFANCDIAAIVRRKDDMYQIISRAVVAKRNGEGEVR